VENQLAATYATIRADRTRYFSALGPGTETAGLLRHGFRACAVSAGLDLFYDWPARKQLPEHLFCPPIRL
jgi:hypothetical protein